MLFLEYFKRPKLLWRDLSNAICWLLELASVPALFLLCAVSRLVRRPVDVGLGPEPLINNIYHKRALMIHGYSAETFAWKDNFISSDYDLNLGLRRWPELCKLLYLFVRSLFRYKALFIYMNGGSLFRTRLLRLLEPHFYQAARMRVVVMPFGSDVQEMIHSPNLYFRHTMAMDYPKQNRRHRQVRGNIERWTRHASWVISGCEWVDYMYHWNTLQLAHFSIDTEQWQPAPVRLREPGAPFRIFHAPNHKTLKGTQALLSAVDELKAEGMNLELVMLRGVPNTVIREALETVDLVADQFVIGWYALFAIEAMALEKPVLCYLREDLLDLYLKAGLVQPGEIPLINTDLLSIKEKIRWAYENRDALPEIGARGRRYVRKHHSVESVGRDFAAILAQLGMAPSIPVAPFPLSGAKVQTESAPVGMAAG